MYTRHCRVNFISIYLITIQTVVKTQRCNDSPFEIRRNTRCWAPNFALDMTGMNRHHCILTCRTRKDSQFLNYQSREGRCQLGSVYVALHRVTGIEAVLFEKVQLLNECANWILATEYGIEKPCMGKSSCFARFIADKYILLGSMVYPNFKGVYYNGYGAPMIVETTDINSIDFLQKEVTGCRMSSRGPNFPNVCSLAIPGGFLYMDNGTLATLYVAREDGGKGYYNSITKKAYYVKDDIVNITWRMYLLLAQSVWISMRYPMAILGNRQNWRIWQMTTNRHIDVNLQWCSKFVFHICKSWFKT